MWSESFNIIINSSTTLANNDVMSESDDINFSLIMPSNFNSAVTPTLGEAAHQFIVASAIADWFAITARGETNDYSAVAAAAIKTIEETLSKRVRPTRGAEA